MDDRVRQLPRGRHGLAREEVVASQRGRMGIAVIEAVAEYGYAGTTVAHIVKGARVSRETFYEHFSSKDECFLIAIGTAIDELVAVTWAAIDSPGSKLDRMDAFLLTYFEWLSERPAIARCLLLELRGAGRSVLQRQVESSTALTDKLLQVLETDDRFAIEVFVASLRQIVGVRIDNGQIATLPELRAPFMQVIRRYATAPQHAAA